jgi:hypothetical protein
MVRSLITPYTGRLKLKINSGRDKCPQCGEVLQDNQLSTMMEANLVNDGTREKERMEAERKVWREGDW